MHSFNLIHQEWIPCILPRGNQVALGLKEIFPRAPEIKEIFDPSPLVTVSLHRFLLAILHRNLGPVDGYGGPRNSEEWKALWEKGSFDCKRILSYLKKYCHRFDLFNEKHPFYQAPSMPISTRDARGREKSYAKPIANLVHELATGNNPTLFDHSFESNGQWVSPAEAARLLIAFQAFAVGGLQTRETEKEKSADNAPLVKGAVILIKGNNLFETLMLNLHKYHQEDEEPFGASLDAPAWERDEETVASDRRPTGYLDLLTWQSRRVRLIPENDQNGHTIVKQVVIMKGNQFPDDYSLHQREPMLAFYKIEKPGKGQAPWSPRAFTEDRALWRDSLALLQSVAEKRARPKLLDWLSDLTLREIIPRAATYNLYAGGLVTSKAKIILWRHECLPLPLQYLENERLLNGLREALELAERVSALLAPGSEKHVTPLRLLALEMLPTDQKGKADPDAIKALVASLGAERPYWARLGQIFSRLLTDLVKDSTEVQGEILYGRKTLPWWAEEIRITAWRAFREATKGLDRDARTLKAVSKAEDEFGLRLNGILKPYKKEKQGGDANG